MVPEESRRTKIEPGMRCLVVGLGVSGFAAVRFLERAGARVAVSDGARPEAVLAEIRQWLQKHDIPWESGGHQSDWFTEAQLVVVSPGVPLTLPALERSRRAGIPIVGELGLGARYLDIPVVAVTGTNGKSTVTELLGEIFLAAGKKVFVGGNLGTPLCAYLLGNDVADLVVLEVSSYQLDTAPDFKPQAAVLLNITPDHLDRYRDFNHYAASKMSIFAAQGPGDFAVINGDDPEIEARVKTSSGHGKFCRFGEKAGGSCRALIASDEITLYGAGEPEIYSLAGHQLRAAPNLGNAAAAILTARLMGCDQAAVKKGLDDFRALAHRLEKVTEADGVQYVDDSKATNVGAVVAALSGQNRPVILIAGGRDKRGGYQPLVPLVREKVKAMVLIGEASEVMDQVFRGVTRVIRAGSMEEAVFLARELAESGDVVLLSPACASFDMFTDYKHRGRLFQEVVLTQSVGMRAGGEG
ncbi:MAG: UDP-N-acetylmuramoyl-L-alanine--D-glutamate ligase [Proteobacteria bacterium]|nr:UDP-N-acetylmuramoyl-L-alanine--D-glutamate ligase [Pseudomonadota bacterium]MBU1686323.1 UDP-N-acetylmuramoyl-L-alanine--D-glutamate ligase [Pseudomonadota bacterium]